MLVLAQANINGLMGKEVPISMYIEEKNIDIMFLCETWLTSTSNPRLSNIFSVNSFERTGRIVGGRRGQRGLICLVKQSIKNQVREVYNSQNGLYTIIQLVNQYIASVYLPPSMPDEMLSAILDDILHRTRGQCIIMGDFNARVGDLVGDITFNVRGRRLMTYLEDSELEILIPENPCFTSRSRSGGGVPDLVLSTVSNGLLFVDQDECFGGSDHAPLRLCLPTNIIKDIVYARWDIAKFKDANILLEYQNFLETTVGVFNNIEKLSVEQIWSVFKNWLSDAAQKSIGKFVYKSGGTNLMWDAQLALMRSKVSFSLRTFQDFLDHGGAGAILNQLRINLIQDAKVYREALKLKRDKLFRNWCLKLGDPKATTFLLILYAQSSLAELVSIAL